MMSRRMLAEDHVEQVSGPTRSNRHQGKGRKKMTTPSV